MCLGFQDRLLNIKAFYLRLSVSNTRNPLPDSLTLCYLPRINGSLLEINDSKIRSDSPAFVSLHRVISAKTAVKGSVFYGSTERVRATEGVRFEVYLRDEKALNGIFRKDEDDEWKLNCKLESEVIGAEVTEAELCVAAEGDVAMCEKVTKRMRKTRSRCFQRLEVIPEEMDGCCGEEMEKRSDGGDLKEADKKDEDMGLQMEGAVSWAVDVGIWVVCLGVGYLVSKASSRSLRRRSII